MSGRFILLGTFLIGYLTTGIKGDGHLTMASATNISITRDGCGSSKLCLGDSECDPAGSALCSFVSAQVVNASTSDVAFELFGNSSGYIALVLSTNVTQGGGLVFVCSRDPFNSARNFFFRTASQSMRDGNITLTNTPNVNSISYNFNRSINGSFHQCQFTAKGLSQAINNNTSGNLSVQVSLVRGSVRADGTFAAPSSTLFSTSERVDLTNVGMTTAAPSTAAPTTTAATADPFGHLATPVATAARITRTGCDDTKLCLGDAGCDPEGNVLCSFISARTVSVSNADVAFELFGNSTGYIALVLTTNVEQGGGLVFVCSRDPFNAARNFFFRTASQSMRNGNFTFTTTPRVDTITYNFNRSINGSFHQCTFTTRQLTQAVNNRVSINFQLTLASGEVRADGTFDAPSRSLFSTNGTVDLAALANTTANATTASPITTAAMTTAVTMAGCSALTNPLTQAIAILMSLTALHLL